MSAKAISEQTGKEFLYKHICTTAAVQNRFRYANVTAETDWERLVQDHPWLLTEVRQLMEVTALGSDLGLRWNLNGEVMQLGNQKLHNEWPWGNTKASNLKK